MAKTAVVLATCDQPHEAGQTVSEDVITIDFGYEGMTYATELCPEHQAEYHSWMQDYLENGARVTSGGRRTKSVPSRSTTSNDVSVIREWANANGHAVSSRGRIPGAVCAAYDAVHG